MYLIAFEIKINKKQNLKIKIFGYIAKEIDVDLNLHMLCGDCPYQAFVHITAE